MINWNDPESWACAVPGFQSVPEIFEALGRKMFPEGEWTGHERQVIRPDVLPKPADVFTPRNGPRYDVRYSPDTKSPATNVARTNQPEDTIADYIAYNRHSALAASLARVSLSEDRNLTFVEWCIAYDASVNNLRRWEKAAPLRNKVFTWMHRRAAAGNLIFSVFDWSSGTVAVLKPDVWQCTFDVARARFLRGAISTVFPNASPPSDPSDLQIFNSTFTHDIFADDKSVVSMLKDSIYERQPTSPADMIELRAQALLRAAGLPDAITKSEAPTHRAKDDGMVTAPPPQPKKRGPRHRYDWVGAEAALMELDGRDDILARIINGEASQAEAEGYVASWFSLRGGEPAESSIRAHVAGIIQHRRESNAAKASD